MLIQGHISKGIEGLGWHRYTWKFKAKFGTIVFCIMTARLKLIKNNQYYFGLLSMCFYYHNAQKQHHWLIVKTVKVITADIKWTCTTYQFN